MGISWSRNEFQVDGKTVLITGGSRGMGLAVARQLAEKGANVVIVARDLGKLEEGIDHIRQGAKSPQTQRFHHISADLTSASESVRVIAETIIWNGGSPPDIVWCVAGSAHPTLFVDTPVSQFHAQMDTNYFSSLYMAHATLTSWLKPLAETKAHDNDTTSPVCATPSAQRSKPPPARHLIFTASFVAFYSFTGYSPYSPAKAALRALSDTLSQEMNLYAAAHPNEPPIRLHTIFPATILTEAYEAENRIKPDLTKKLEEDDEGQSPETVAAKSIRALETGQELVTTDILTGLVKNSMLGGSVRGGLGRALLAWVLAGLMGLVMIFVRGDMDRKVKTWGRQFGPSGMRENAKHT